MKLAISNIAWPEERNSEIQNLFQQLHIEGIELAPPKTFTTLPKVSQEELMTIKDRWNNIGAQIVALQSLLYGQPEMTLFDTKKAREQTLNYLYAMIDIASALEARILVFGSPKNRYIDGIPFSKAYDIALQFFRTLGEYAKNKNTIFCIEPNAPQYNCNFITNTKDAIEFVKNVNHPGFGLHIDAGVMTLNNANIEQILDNAFEYIQHFHISEPFLENITNNTSHHERIGKHLKKLGYNKWVSIEMKENEQEDPLRIVEKALVFAQNNYLS